MISATDALLLPNAQLSESQQEKLDQLAALIRDSVSAGQRNKIQVNELDLNVLAAMDYRLKKSGTMMPEWIGQRGTVDPNTVVHYYLNLDPEEAALAVLTEAQLVKLEQLDETIRKNIETDMSFKGVGGIKIDELDSAILTAMTYRLKRLDWKPEWKAQTGRTGKHVVCYYLYLDVEDVARDKSEEKARQPLA